MAAGVRHPFYAETEEEDDESEDEDLYRDTELICGGCLEPVKLGEDIVLLQLVLPNFNGTQLQYFVLFDEDGEPEAEPLFFKYECWENTGQDIAERNEDQPAVEEPDAILECDYCRSSIRMGEKCVTVQIGELTTSERKPPSCYEEESTTFLPADESPYVLCLSCVRTFIETEQVEIWEHVSQNGECEVCTRGRCWRAGRCTCKCHIFRG